MLRSWFPWEFAGSRFDVQMDVSSWSPLFGLPDYLELSWKGPTGVTHSWLQTLYTKLRLTIPYHKLPLQCTRDQNTVGQHRKLDRELSLAEASLTRPSLALQPSLFLAYVDIRRMVRSKVVQFLTSVWVPAVARAPSCASHMRIYR